MKKNNSKNKNKLSSSFLTTTPEKGKKTALKLLNKYAESFNSLKEENSLLKQQIKDLNLNLSLNKSIIENFFSGKKLGEKIDFLVKNIFKENQALIEEKNLLEKKNLELNNKINYNDQNYIESMMQIKEENEKLKTKIFLLEQNDIKKNFIIEQQNNKINRSRSKNKNLNSKLKNEIYITNPSKLVNNINNELIVYKNMYKELRDVLKDNRDNIDKYEKKIIELQNENNNLRNEYKNYIFNSNKERETLMQRLKKSRNDLLNNNNNFLYNSKTTENFILNDNYFMNKINRKQFEHEDFLDIIKNVGLTLDKFEKMIKFKNFEKCKEIIEQLLNLVKDKERIISLLQKENDNLNQKNYALNAENIKYKNKNNGNNNINNNGNNIKINNTMKLFKEYLGNNNINENIIYDNGNNNNDTIIDNNNKNHEIKEKNYSTTVKIPEEIINNTKKDNKKFIGTLASITSSEYKEGCPGIESFLSTIKFDELNGTKKTNGLKENNDNNIKLKNN